MLKWYFNLLLVLLTLSASAQSEVETKLPPDWKPSFFRFGVDVSPVIGTIFKEGFSGIEGYAEFDTHRFYIIGEYGVETNTRKEENFDYYNSGRFFRAGFEYNVTPYSMNRNVISIGARYARSTFSDNLEFERETLFGDQSFYFENQNLTAQWIEFTGSMKVRIWKELFFGAVVRVKTGKRLTGIGDLVPYDVPGFGRHYKNGTTEKSTVMGLSYYLSWTIPFREKEIPPKPKL